MQSTRDFLTTEAETTIDFMLNNGVLPSPPGPETIVLDEREKTWYRCPLGKIVFGYKLGIFVSLFSKIIFQSELAEVALEDRFVQGCCLVGEIEG